MRQILQSINIGNDLFEAQTMLAIQPLDLSLLFLELFFERLARKLTIFTLLLLYQAQALILLSDLFNLLPDIVLQLLLFFLYLPKLPTDFLFFVE